MQVTVIQYHNAEVTQMEMEVDSVSDPSQLLTDINIQMGFTDEDLQAWYTDLVVSRTNWMMFYLVETGRDMEAHLLVIW